MSIEEQCSLTTHFLLSFFRFRYARSVSASRTLCDYSIASLRTNPACLLLQGRYNITPILFSPCDKFSTSEVGLLTGIDIPTTFDIEVSKLAFSLPDIIIYPELNLRSFIPVFRWRPAILQKQIVVELHERWRPEILQPTEFVDQRLECFPGRNGGDVEVVRVVGWIAPVLPWTDEFCGIISTPRLRRTLTCVGQYLFECRKCKQAHSRLPPR
jgi:hypothetical protein